MRAGQPTGFTLRICGERGEQTGGCSRARGQRLARILRRERKQVPKSAEDRRGQEMQKPASSDIRGRRLTPKELKSEQQAGWPQRVAQAEPRGRHAGDWPPQAQATCTAQGAAIPEGLIAAGQR